MLGNIFSRRRAASARGIARATRRAGLTGSCNVEHLEVRCVLAAPVGVNDNYQLLAGETLTTDVNTLAAQSSDFSGDALPAFLRGRNYGVSNGTVHLATGVGNDTRLYVETAQSILQDKDFRFELSITTALVPQTDIYWMGYGQGDWILSGTFQTPPYTLSFRNHGPGTIEGLASVVNGPVSIIKDDLIRLSSPGTHRFRIDKIRHAITFSVDAYYGGQFVPDASYHIEDIRTVASALDPAKARVFFGTITPETKFDDFYLGPINPSGVLANDTDADNDVLTAEIISQPAHGNLTFNPNGTFTYVPNSGYTGPDSFQYTAKDATASSAPATVTINVNPLPPGPVAVADAYTTAEDTTLEVAPSYSKLTSQSQRVRIPDLKYSDASQLLYVISSDPNDNSTSRIDAINPFTGNRVTVASLPGQTMRSLDISQDGSTLFLAVGNTIRRYRTSDNQETGRYDLASNLYAEKLAIFPGSTNKILVTLANSQQSPRQSGDGS